MYITCTLSVGHFSELCATPVPKKLPNCSTRKDLSICYLFTISASGVTEERIVAKSFQPNSHKKIPSIGCVNMFRK